MRASLILAGVLMLGACRPHPKPPAAGDSTVTPPPADTVTAPVDSFDDPADSIPTAVPHDTILPESRPAADRAGPGPGVSVTLIDDLGGHPTLATATAASRGLPVGLSFYRPERWCTHSFTLVFSGATPDVVPGLLKKAAYCKVRLVLAMPLLEMQARTGTPFDLAKAKALHTGYVRIAGLLRAYADSGVLWYVNLNDDLGSTHRWSTRLPALADIAEQIRDFKAKVPGVPAGVRATSQQLAGYGGWTAANRPTVLVTQWTTPRAHGDMLAYFRQQRDLLPKIGTRCMIYAFNVHEPDGAGSSPASADDLRRWGRAAILFDPASNLGFLSFKYDPDYTLSGERGVVWRELVSLAASAPDPVCGR